MAALQQSNGIHSRFKQISQEERAEIREKFSEVSVGRGCRFSVFFCSLQCQPNKSRKGHKGSSNSDDRIIRGHLSLYYSPKVTEVLKTRLHCIANETHLPASQSVSRFLLESCRVWNAERRCE